MTRSFRQHSLAEARRLLDRCERRGVAYLYDHGYRWLQSVFLPALLRVDRSRSREDLWRRVQGWYFLGDVHDFNKAPQTAITAYRKALRADSGCAAAWREIGNMLEDMGRSAEAEAALRRALRLNPEDEDAQLDLDGLSQRSLYRKGDPILASSEALAQGRSSAALAALAGRHSVVARQARARALAARGDREGALREWERIAGGKGKVDLQLADHFFTKDLLEREVRFWDAVLRISPRAVEGTWGWNEERPSKGSLQVWLRGFAREKRDRLIACGSTRRPVPHDRAKRR